MTIKIQKQKSGWLQPLSYHNLTCSNLCILKDEYRKFKLLNDSFDITLDNLEMSAKIRWYHCDCITGMGETCNHVAASMFLVEAVVGTGLTHPSCTSSVNEEKILNAQKLRT